MSDTADSKTILVVEDDESIRDFLVNVLTQAGFKVVSGKDGEEGLAQAKASKPDFVLLDIMMPKLDGLGMLRQMRNDPALSHTHVTMLTNISDPDSMATALEFGVKDYLVKSNLDTQALISDIKSKLFVK